MDSRDPLQQLWRLAQQRDARAFDQLRINCRALVRGEIRCRIHGIQEENLLDLEQIVWTSVWTAVQGFRGASLFSTWLIGITKNVIFTEMRRQCARQQAVVQIAEAMACTPQPDDSLSDHLAIRTALQNLPAEERAIIQMRYYEQLTDEEIAERLNLSLGTTKSRIRRGLHRMRGTLLSEEERENAP